MKRMLVILYSVLLVFCIYGVASAGLVTLTFDPNDILDLYPSAAGTSDTAGQNKATQQDARRIHQSWGTSFNETFYNPPAPHSQPSDYNAYVSWRNSLSSDGDGIAVFNTWLLGYPNAIPWGETVITKPGTTVSATATDGWSYSVFTDPYGSGANVAQWYTTDSSKRLRPTDLGGANIGSFSITADLYNDVNANGIWDSGDTDVTFGQNIRFWVGTLNGDDLGFYRSDTNAIFFNGANYGSGAGSGGSGFEGAMNASAVPIPAAVWLLGTGLVGLFGVRRRFMK